MILKLLSILSIVLKLLNKFYDEHIRRKYKREGRDDVNRENKKIVEVEMKDAKVISDKVDKESEEDIDKGLIDPRLN